MVTSVWFFLNLKKCTISFMFTFMFWNKIANLNTKGTTIFEIFVLVLSKLYLIVDVTWFDGIA